MKANPLLISFCNSKAMSFQKGGAIFLVGVESSSFVTFFAKLESCPFINVALYLFVMVELRLFVKEKPYMFFVKVNYEWWNI